MYDNLLMRMAIVKKFCGKEDSWIFQPQRGAIIMIGLAYTRIATEQ